MGFLLAGWLLSLAPAQGAPLQNPDLNQFFQVKAKVFVSDWLAVRAGMEAYLKDYPAGKMRDEALYWLARSLEVQSRQAKDVFTVMTLKRQAFASLERLAGEFPASPWRGDGRVLQASLAGELAALGDKDLERFLREIVKEESVDAREIKQAALESIIGLEAGMAIPAFQSFLKTEPDAAMRKSAVLLLGRRYTHEAVAILEDSARNDADAGVRREASDWLERIRIRLIPLRLNYYCYELKLKDPAARLIVPEDRVVQIPVPHAKPGDEARVMEAVGRAFEGRVAFTGSQATSNSAALESFGPMSQISHRIAGFFIQVNVGWLNKTADSISGQVQISAKLVSFQVDGSRDLILAARQGDRVAAVFLEMAPKESDPTAARKTPGRSGKPAASDKEPVYHSGFTLGDVKLFSTRSELDSGFSKSNIADLGLAKAEIPGPGGKWILTGQLLLLRREQTLIGRMAALVRPAGSTAAAGAEIRGPMGDPAAFKTGSGTPAAPAKNPDAPASRELRSL